MPKTTEQRLFDALGLGEDLRPEPQPSFDVTREDAQLIRELARYAVGLMAEAGARYDFMTAVMDLTACHANGCPLRLGAMVAALKTEHQADVAHDLAGIRRHLDRTTGKLGGCFLPRFHGKEV